MLFVEGSSLLRRRFGLIPRLPIGVRHPVDQLSSAFFTKLDSLAFGGFLIPARQTVSAEPGEVHERDVLYVCPLAQMIDQPSEGGSLELDARAFVDVHV